MATAKQIAARKLFAERARAGTLKKKRAKNPVKSASQSGYIVSFFVKGERKKLAHVATKSEANKLAKEYRDSTGRDIQIISAKDFIEEMKKRAKNPVKPKMDNNAKYPSGYSGAYPGRVKQVFSEGKKLYVILNDGSKHSVTYKDYGDEMPRVGDTFPGYNKNPIAKKSLTARQYVTRPSQATKKPPSARLTTRRTKALKAPAGYFPNPILGFPFCVSAKAEGMSAFYKIAYFRDSETAVLFAKAYANLHQYLAIKVEEK